MSSAAVLLFIMREERFWRATPYKVDNVIENIVKGLNDEDLEVQRACMFTFAQTVVSKEPLRTKAIDAVGGPEGCINLANRKSRPGDGNDDGLVQMALQVATNGASGPGAFKEEDVPYIDFIISRLQHVKETTLETVVRLLAQHPQLLSNLDSSNIFIRLQEERTSLRPDTVMYMLEMIWYCSGSGYQVQAVPTPPEMNKGKVVLDCILTLIDKNARLSMPAIQVLLALAPQLKEPHVPGVLTVLENIYKGQIKLGQGANKQKSRGAIFLPLLTSLPQSIAPLLDKKCLQYLKHVLLHGSSPDVLEQLRMYLQCQPGTQATAEEALLSQDVINHLCCYEEAPVLAVQLLYCLYQKLGNEVLVARDKQQLFSEKLPSRLCSWLTGDLTRTDPVITRCMADWLEMLPHTTLLKLTAAEVGRLHPVLKWANGLELVEGILCRWTEGNNGVQLRAMEFVPALLAVKPQWGSQTLTLSLLLSAFLSGVSIEDNLAEKVVSYLDELAWSIAKHSGKHSAQGALHKCQLVILGQLAATHPDRVASSKEMIEAHHLLKIFIKDGPDKVNWDHQTPTLPAATIHLATKLLASANVTLVEYLDLFLNITHTLMEKIPGRPLPQKYSQAAVLYAIKLNRKQCRMKHYKST